MSNLENQHAKRIKIRPIELQSESDVKDEISHISHLKSDIDQLQQQLASLRTEKQRLLQETKEWVASEKTLWESEKEKLVEEARDTGYKQGFNVGEQAGSATYDDLIATMNNLADAAKKDYQQTVMQSEDTIKDIALIAAKKILQQQLRDDPDMFAGIANACIQEINDTAVDVSIFVHPDQYDIFIQQKYELQNLLDDGGRLSIKVKKTVPQFGCIVEHPLGQIDAGVDTQLSEIRRVLQEIRMDD